MAALCTTVCTLAVILALWSIRSTSAFVTNGAHAEETHQPTSNDDIINVFVIPHSHMDVGWVYTIQESMHAYAANVYTTVVKNLAVSPNRRFIAVEQEFFRLWWDEIATQQQKEQTRKFVSNGQFEFIIGGQVMHDEAVTELSAIIQQMTEGHAFIYETFGVRPQFGWHVDPFGASAATPTLFALMGFDAHLTSRIDYDKKAEMMKNKGLQFVWQASPSLGSAQQMFMHVMDTYSYCVPMDKLPFSDKQGFMWNGVAKFPDPPADGIYPNMSDPVTKQNIGQYADVMVANIKQRAAWFKTQQLLWPWGCDKQFFNATVQFQNMDLLLQYINQHKTTYGVKVRYATLGEFFGALHGTNTTWGIKNSGDFLPYSTARDEAWTGFYTSRIELKGLARRSQSALRAGETLFALYTHMYNITRSVNTTRALGKLKMLRWATAEVQHHDGVTGTEAPKVRDMYTTHLSNGTNGTMEVVTEILTELTKMNRLGGESNDRSQSRFNAVTNIDKPVGKDAIPIVVYNSLGWTVNRMIRVDVSAANVTVLNITGQQVQSQINPPDSPGDPYQLYFFANLPPLGYRSFVLLYYDKTARSKQRATIRTYDTAAANNGDGEEDTMRNDILESEIAIENKCFQVTYDKTTNMLTAITDKRSGKVTSMTAVFMEYGVYYNVLYGQPSNNYIFRPKTPAEDISGHRVTLDVISGDLVNETRQQFYSLFDNTSRHSVTLRLVSLPTGHSDDIACGHIELDFKVGPLTPNKELVYRLSTHLSSNGNIFTDVNAYQTMNRSRRHDAPTGQNYFPMVSAAYIEDMTSDMRLVLLSDRSHGVSSLQDGQLEVMLHRRLINNEFQDHDYNLTLQEPSVATASFWMLLGNRSMTSELRHRAWLQLENPPVVVRVGSGWTSKGDVDWTALRNSATRTTALTTELPPNVHLLTFKTPGWLFNNTSGSVKTRTPDSSYNLDRILLRLQHLYEVGEHPVLSKAVTVNLQDVLSSLGTIKVVKERSLSAVWDISQLTRWTWKTQNGDSGRLTSAALNTSNSIAPPSFKVTLNPQEIKTFFVTMQTPPS